MSGQKSLEQIIMDAIDFCTHTRCKKCEYYGKDSTYEHNGKCRGRMMADHLRKNGVVVREKGEWRNNKDGYPECDRCGYMPQYDPMIDDIYYSDFCPNCGADMTGGDRNV